MVECVKGVLLIYFGVACADGESGVYLPLSMPMPIQTPPRLTKKQVAFRDAILGGFMPSEAYRKAFDAKGMSKKCISVKAAELLRNKKIAVAITVATQSGLQDCPTNDAKAKVLPALSPRVRWEMEERLTEICCAGRLDPAEMFDDLNHVKSIRDLPEHVRRAIAGFEVDPVSFVTKVKFVDKLNAIRLYSQLAGDIPREKGTVAPPVKSQYDPTKLTDEEWREYQRIRRKALIDQSEDSPVS